MESHLDSFFARYTSEERQEKARRSEVLQAMFLEMLTEAACAEPP